MGKKSTGSSALGTRTRKSAKSIPDSRPDSQIDYSDIAALTDEQLDGMKRIGRPLLGSKRRHLIAIRVDPTVLAKIKRRADADGKGYQTLINEVLGEFVKRKAA